METSMNLKLVWLFRFSPLCPHLRMPAPKPSVAEAQKVVQMISGDDQILRRVEADIVG
jgi:hypothetical protein